MVTPLLVLDVVGLTRDMLGPRAPALERLSREGFVAPVRPPLPAVTCTVQSTYLTGLPPRDHGAVSNGWYFRELSEIFFWRQSYRLVEGERVWETAGRRHPGFTCAQLFWWYNMHSSADWSITPRPIYPADGRKVPGVYSHPPELGTDLTARLGRFPLFQFWGPRAGIESSRWIANSARAVLEEKRPTLALVYLPHLDYDLQRHGPRSPEADRALGELDSVAGGLIDAARALGMEVIVLGEYAIGSVSGSVSLNRVLRREGWLAVQSVSPSRGERWELLDAGASRAFAVADHQVAHVYVRDPADVFAVGRCLEAVEGVDLVLGREGKIDRGLDHARSGELVAVARRDRWFDYAYWLDDALAPDFARTVDIHRKPGYDPVELFLDPDKRWIQARILGKLARKALGFRGLLDVIPLRTDLVKGSHGRVDDDPAAWPILVSSSKRAAASSLDAVQVKDVILETLGI